MSGSKDMINMLHKCNHASSYHEIREQNKAWANMVSTRHSMLSIMGKGVVTHSTMENNDASQEGVTGLVQLMVLTKQYLVA